ncbi:hypothetical protein EJP617_13080 [Erwinia sp. Ejp617]|nr:hypothetical protein EJP617_13080 [Erwinia sp. Ejp617]
MLINLNTFAAMLRARPGELLHNVRNTGCFKGMTLPRAIDKNLDKRYKFAPHYMFDMTDAIEFKTKIDNAQP